jgi:hypothetical protein
MFPLYLSFRKRMKIPCNGLYFLRGSFGLHVRMSVKIVVE